jgi:hypothetical protein
MKTMKKLILSLSIVASTFAFGQISEGGYPTTFKKTISGELRDTKIDYEVKKLQKPDLSQIIAKDYDASVKGEMYRIGVLKPASISFSNSGTWKTLSNGDKIWRLGIRVPEAMALSLYFTQDVKIPEGGKLHAYNQNHSQYIGGYTFNTPSFSAMEMVEGELITLEYYMPAGSTLYPTIEISNIGYYYRGVEDRIAAFREGKADYEKAEACQVDVACSDITGWEEQRDAVVQYTIVSGNSIGVCSASIINNTANDCKPYVLTANHCGEPTTSSELSNDVFYFNYQRPTCSPGNTNVYNGAKSQTMSGATLKASSELGTAPGSSSITGADFALFELNSAIPNSYNPFYAGWNRATASSPSGVGIHHPAGHEKKISTYTSSLVSATYNGGWSGAHWRVFWSATTNGHGVTEGGSSGSPLFNQNGQIIGHLSGGSSFCTQTSAPDLYGKIDRAWESEGNNTNQRLKPWLDPTGSGVTSLNGSYTPCSSGGNSGPCNASAAHSQGCDEYIENVSLNTINKTSGCTNYSDYTATSTNLSKGQSYTLTLTPFANGQSGAAYNDDEIAAWIDWNNDGDYTDSGEQIGYVIVAIGWSSVFNFTVPNTATLGSLKMRTRLSFQPDDGPISPCGITEWGEVEDYTVIISESGTANNIEELTLNSINIYPNPTNNSFTLDLGSNNENVKSIEVTDLTGRGVISFTNFSSKSIIDLTQEPSGIYLVKINSSLGNFTKKVIKF